jgi:hypothetical protein
MDTRRLENLPENEVRSLWGYISSSIDRILLCLDGLGEEYLNWRPLDSANSLFAIAVHIMGHVEANILGVLCGERIDRQREEEFKAQGSAAGPVQRRWLEVRESVSSRLAQLPASALDRKYEHPRSGSITGRELLVRVVARHAAEHVGHAELTRDLLYSFRGRELPKRDSLGHPLVGFSDQSDITK